MNLPQSTFRFDIAFSFAGPHRDQVRAIAELVAAKVGKKRVFYDEWYEAEILGDDMDVLLQRIFSQQSLMVVADISREYIGRSWSQAEARAIRSLRMTLDTARDETSRLRLLNARFGSDDTSGILTDAGYLDAVTSPVERCADVILERLHLLQERMLPKRTVRYFVSYAREDGKLPDALLKELSKQLGASRSYEFQSWRDQAILPGKNWHEEIQAALDACDFGLLLVSPAFLGKEYISEHELPAFVRGNKPCVPVLLRRIDFENHDLKKLASTDFFSFTTPRDSRPRSFEECTSAKHREAFAQKLFSEIVGRLDNPAKTPGLVAGTAQDSDDETSEQQSKADGQPRAKGIVDVYTEQISMRSGEKVKDALQIEQHVTLFAELIAARATGMPLSVGLFGDWGSGKSHFMRMLEQRINALALEKPEEWAARLGDGAAKTTEKREGAGPWCQRVVSIRFNAWSYLDANLWASLVTEIFEKLFAFLRPSPDALAQVEQLLAKATGATARAVEQVAVAEEQKIKAAGELNSAVETRKAEQSAMDGMIHGLKALLPEVLPETMQKQVKESLGVDKAMETLEELQAVVDQARRDARGWRHLWAEFSKKDGRAWRLGWLALAAVGALVLGPLVAKFWHSAQPGAQEIGKMVSQGLVVLAPFVAWLTWFSRQANGALHKLEGWQRRAEAEQKKALETPVVVAARQKVAAAVAEEKSAKSRLDQAEKREEQLREQARALAPERRLARFIEERAASADYRGQLGLVSLARRDFEELSRFLRAAQGRTDAEVQLPERIVLYVDDLDRCQPEKVVEVLQAVHLLLAFDLFAVVVGVDQRCLNRSLRGELRGLLSPHADSWRDEERDGEARRAQPATSRPGNGSSDETPATPLDYLEKIFQIPFHLPKMGATGFGTLMDRLTGPREKAEQEISPKLPHTVRTKEKGAPTDTSGPEQIAGSTLPAQPVDPSAHAIAAISHGLILSTAPTQPVDPAADPAPASETMTEPVIGIVPLEQWERDSLKEYHALIKTPRAATRFLNTYRLVRAGLTDKEWHELRGTGDGSLQARVVMLLLAAAAGSPSVVRNWFTLLRNAPNNRWTQPTPNEFRKLPEWRRFAGMRRALGQKLRPPVSAAIRREWIDRVARFAF